MFRTRSSVFVVQSVVLFGLAGCVARQASPFANLSPEAAQALARERAAARERVLQDDLRDAVAVRTTRNVLLLSGGDAHGAFGCGVLAGWRSATDEPRPTFDVVTGVSTGALMATFALLGEPRDDEVLRDVYTRLRDRDVFESPLAPGPANALCDTAPLRRLIARHVTADVVRRVADAHREGRRLYVATVELDTGEVVIWPMTRIAADATSTDGSVDRRSLDRFRQILLASASIPMFFPPVEIDGGLHVDAGLREPLFLRDAMLGPATAGTPDGPAPTVWAIFNGPLDVPAPRHVKNDVIDIGSRSLGVYTHALERLSLRETAHVAAAHQPAFRFRWISEDKGGDVGRAAAAESTPGLFQPMFDPAIMSARYERGMNAARRPGGGWQDGPPPVAGDDAVTRDRAPQSGESAG